MSPATVGATVVSSSTKTSRVGGVREILNAEGAIVGKTVGVAVVLLLLLLSSSLMAALFSLINSVGTAVELVVAVVVVLLLLFSDKVDGAMVGVVVASVSFHEVGAFVAFPSTRVKFLNAVGAKVPLIEESRVGESVVVLVILPSLNGVGISEAVVVVAELG